jgi:hypothetical protein
MSPSDRVALLYPQAPGSLFVAFYDSQGYDGGKKGKAIPVTGSPLIYIYIYIIE